MNSDLGRSGLPLAGITIVSLEQALSAPYATRQLADLGARVIKVERPGTGDFARVYDESVQGLASYFVWANRSKESICLDLKQPEGLEILRRLVIDADVFVQNLAPGAAKRLDLDAETLRRQNSRLIVCDVSGYGADGGWSGRKAYDLLVQAEVGLLSLTGTEDVTARVGISIADISAGMYAFSGILAALLRRERTGEGATVEVSLFDSLAEWLGQPMYYAQYSGSQPARTGTHHPTIAPYGDFRCRDDRSIILAVQNEREWATFCACFLHDPALAQDERFASNSARVRHREALLDIVSRQVERLDSEEAARQLDDLGIANARQNDVSGLSTHPAQSGRERWSEFGSPVGALYGPVSPISIFDAHPRMDAIPDVGEHTEAILAELGYSPGERAVLKSRQVI